MKIAARILIVMLAVPMVAYLLYVGTVSGLRIVAEPELSTGEMVKALMVHCLLPITAAPVVVVAAGIGWWATTLVESPTPIRRRQDRDYTSDDETTATVITLREPNIDLSITLTGDAAKDAIGRKKIGAVMEHYGSGAVTENATSLDPIPGPSIPAKVTSKITAPVFPVATEGGAS